MRVNARGSTRCARPCEQRREGTALVVTATFKAGGDDKNGDRQINHALSLWLSVRLLVAPLYNPLPPSFPDGRLPREELCARACTYEAVEAEADE
jgi:hypothetical protein